MIEEFQTRREDRYEENHRSELEQPLHIRVYYRAIVKRLRFSQIGGAPEAEDLSGGSAHRTGQQEQRNQCDGAATMSP